MYRSALLRGVGVRAAPVARERVWPAAAAPTVVVLVLHGGAETGTRRVRPWRLAYLRMLPFCRVLREFGSDAGVEVRALRNRVRGWNAPDEDPVVDARHALRRIRAQRPGVPVVVVGHSMGGRVALEVADDPAVTGVCALAPWVPPETPVEPVTGRVVLIAHGVNDGRTSPEASYRYACCARLVAAQTTRIEVAGDGHAMLRRARLWHRLTAEFTLSCAGVRSFRELLPDVVGAQCDNDPLRIAI